MSAAKTEIVPIRAVSELVQLPATSGMMAFLMDPAGFAQAMKVAETFAGSQLVPVHLRGKPADCFIALAMAVELQENPIIVMQSIYVVNGKAGWSASYMIARANRSGVFALPITWRTEGNGDSLAVTATTALARTGEEVTVTASMAMAAAEKWTVNPKYKSMPEHMLKWRSATMLIRLYAPEVMLGYHTADEIEDVTAAANGERRDVTPKKTPEPKTEPAANPRGHDPSWTAKVQASFCARLIELGTDYDTIAAWREGKGNPRPSQMSGAARHELLLEVTRQASARDAKIAAAPDTQRDEPATIFDGESDVSNEQARANAKRIEAAPIDDATIPME